MGTRTTGTRPGPKPKYSEDIRQRYGGAPRVSVRLEPDLFEWVRKQGGGGWLHAMLRELRELSTQEGFARWWEKLRVRAD